MSPASPAWETHVPVQSPEGWAPSTTYPLSKRPSISHL